MLEEALFSIFRRQAVNSLKRNFSDICKDTLGFDKVINLFSLSLYPLLLLLVQLLLFIQLVIGFFYAF